MKVAMPVITPRASEVPRPVRVPSSESASERPMLIAAPTAAASPISSAAWRAADVGGGEVGARVEIVPSIRPISAGWTYWSARSRSLARRQASSPTPLTSYNKSFKIRMP